MTRTSIRPLVLLFAASGIVLAQQPPVDPQTAPQSNPGWRRATDPAPVPPAQDQGTPEQASQDQQAPPPVSVPDPPSRDAYGQVQQQQPPAAQPPRPYGLPAQVTLKPGTFITIRVNQMLASNKSTAGDTFSGTLTQPVVVDGIVVAQRNQTVYGRVAEADKVKGMHRLGLEITGLGLADGTQAALHTTLMSRQSPVMPYGYGHRDEGVITTTTADGSTPAAGSVVGVIATKGHNSEVYPGTLLTFQTESPVAIATSNSSAYRYVGPDDYSPRNGATQTVATRPTYAYGPGYYPYPYWGAYPYWGPVGFGFGFGGWGWGGFRGGFRR